MKTAAHDIANRYKFPHGAIVITQGVVDSTDPEEVAEMLARHLKNDWGAVEQCATARCYGTERQCDWHANDYSIRHDLRVLSHYTTDHDVDVWIITEADRSVTTMLLPQEY